MTEFPVWLEIIGSPPPQKKKKINHYTVYVESTSAVYGVMWNPGCGFKTFFPLSVRGCASFDALSIIASIFEKC